MVVVTRRALAVAALPLLILGACRAIAGYRDLEYDPNACAPVVLSSNGAGRIRLVNAGTGGSASDFCVRATGSSDWGRPVFVSSRPSCDTGLASATATVPFAVEPGSIDVEAIAVGSACSASATATLTSIAVGSSTQGAPVVTVLRMGGKQTPERLVALPEEPTPAEAQGVRAVNALDGTQAIQLGHPSSSALPATIPLPELPVPIAPGQVEPPGHGRTAVIDPAGYMQIGPNLLGVDLAGQTNAFFVVETQNGTSSLFAIGDPTDNAYALRGLLCDEGHGLPASGSGPPVLASCSLTPLSSLAVDTFHVDLYGEGAPFEDERRQPIYEAIAGRTSDLMCILLADRQSDKIGIETAAQQHFPYAYFPNPASDLDTQPNDPREIDGAVPPPPAGPPCAGVDAAAIDTLYTCLTANCSSTGDMTGVIAPPSCILQNCVNQLEPLYSGGTAGTACWDCIIVDASSLNSLQHGKTVCAEDARQPFLFGGQTTMMILSRYPLAEQQVFVLPSTNYRNAVLSAEVLLDGDPVDFYCATFAGTGVDFDVPYDGNYGTDRTTTLPDGGQLVENGYQDELDLQTKRAIDFIRTNSTKTQRGAIVAGVTAATQVTETHGKLLLGDMTPEVVAAFDSRLGGAFVAAEPPSFAPTCDVCASSVNEYQGGSIGLYALRTYLFNFLPGSTVESSVWGADISVVLHPHPYEPLPDGGTTGPVSGTFPRLVRVVRPRAQQP